MWFNLNKIIYNLVYYLLSFYIMTSQLFKENIPMKILYDFLEKICVKDSVNNLFIFSKAAFKKAEIHNLLTNFKEVIKPYYHMSNQYYVERERGSWNNITVRNVLFD